MRERQLCNEHIYYFGGLLCAHLSSLSWLGLLAGGLRSPGSLVRFSINIIQRKSHNPQEKRSDPTGSQRTSGRVLRVATIPLWGSSW